MEKIGEGLRKLILAGIGTAAVTAEKSREILDELVKKGEITVEQGKALNQELKHNIREAAKKTEASEEENKDTEEQMKEFLDRLTPEQMAPLKKQLDSDRDIEESSKLKQESPAWTQRGFLCTVSTRLRY